MLSFLRSQNQLLRLFDVAKSHVGHTLLNSSSDRSRLLCNRLRTHGCERLPGSGVFSGIFLGGGSVPEFHLALAKPIQVRPKTSPPLGPLLSLILLVLNLLPLILSTSRKSSSSMLTRGSLRDCLPPVAPRLSDVIEGELPALCAVSAGFPQGPRCGSTSPAYL